MVDYDGMQCDTDIGAWRQYWSSMRRRFAVTISPAKPFDVPYIRHGEKLLQIRRLYASL